MSSFIRIPGTPEQFVTVRRSKRITIRPTNNNDSFTKPSQKLASLVSRLQRKSKSSPSASRIISACPMISTNARKTDAIKTSPNVTGHDKERTSTPTKRAKRLSEEIDELSPIGQSDEIENNYVHNSFESTYIQTPPPNKLGRPLLSSTKLHHKLDNDRLTNAARLYEGRLRVRLDSKESELLKSELLHKNAIFDTFISPSSGKCETPQSKGEETFVSPQPPMATTAKRKKHESRPLKIHYDTLIPKVKCNRKYADVGDDGIKQGD